MRRLRRGAGLVLSLASLFLLSAAVAPDAPVADAAMRGDRDAVQTLLASGADVNASQGDGMTALHWAAENGDAQLAEMLLYAGASVTPTTRIGAYTPLHVAARSGHGDLVSVLLANGADAGAATSTSGVTAMHLAALSGAEDIVFQLAEAGAEVDALESSWAQTPLIFAAAQNRHEVVRTLLSLGADPDHATLTEDLSELARLDRVAAERRREVLDAFSVTEDTATPTQLQAAVEAGRSAYREAEDAAQEESEELSEEDERRQEQAQTIASKGGMTALLHSTRQGHVEATLALLDGGADIDRATASDGTTPLLMATINGQFDLAKTLLERGADPNIASTLNGVAPLWAAVNAAWQPRTRYPQPQQQHLQQTTYLDLMEELLVAGADPDARLSMHPWYMVYNGCGNRNCGLVDTNGSTAFFRAAYATDIPAMKLLVEHGADPNIPTVAPERRQRLSPDEFLRQQNKNRIVSDSAFSTLEESEQIEALIAVRDGLPDSLQAEFPTFALESSPEKTRTDLVTRVEYLDSLAALAPDPSGLPPIPAGGPGVFAIHAASGVGYGEGFAGNAHRHAPDAWLSAVKYIIEELGADVNTRDLNGYNAIHHAAARGDNEMIHYLVERGGDVMAISRRGQSTVDLANGPVQRVSPFPETVALLESLGAINNNNCMSCQ